MEKQQEKQRVLMTFIESGMGHITSIQSMSDSLRRFYGDKFEIIDSYIMTEDNDPALMSWEKFIIKQTKNTNKVKGFGSFIFFFLNLMGGVKFMRATHRSIFSKFTKHCMAAFAKHRPDIIVSTHYFLTFAALEYKKKVDPHCKVITYNPDNNVHVWWDNREHLFIVNNAAAYREAVGKRKFNPAMVKQINFIARDQILEANLTREEYREKLGIDKDRFCVIVADGVYACAKAKKITDQLLKSDKEMTLVMLAGKNEKLERKYKKLIADSKVKPNIKLVVLPFTRDIHEYYKAADVFVTKAGPNAILDSVFMGTPIVASYYAHPIEKATVKLFVDELKVGKAIYNPNKIRRQIEAWIDDPSELKELEKNCAKVDKNDNGGKAAADLIYEESLRKEVFTEKKPYDNLLYELAEKGEFDTYTTPINFTNVNKNINYKKLKKPGLLARFNRMFTRGFVYTLSPIINKVGFSIRIKGKKNLKGIKTGAVSVSNHVSTLDCLWNLQVFRKKKFYVTVAPHNYKKGMLGGLMKAGGIIPIPDDPALARQFMTHVKSLLEEKAIVHFYPEQALWKNYKQSRPMKKGAFHFAVDCNVPVIPVIFLFRKRNRVTVQICEPIYPDQTLSKAEAIADLQSRAQSVYDDTVINFYGYDEETYTMYGKNLRG